MDGNRSRVMPSLAATAAVPATRRFAMMTVPVRSPVRRKMYAVSASMFTGTKKSIAGTSNNAALAAAPTPAMALLLTEKNWKMRAAVEPPAKRLCSAV